MDLFFVSMNQEMYMSADPDCPLAKDEIDASLTSKTGVQTKNKTKKTQKKTRKRSKQKKRQESVQRETKTRWYVQSDSLYAWPDGSWLWDRVVGRSEVASSWTSTKVFFNKRRQQNKYSTKDAAATRALFSLFDFERTTQVVTDNGKQQRIVPFLFKYSPNQSRKHRISHRSCSIPWINSCQCLNPCTDERRRGGNDARGKPRYKDEDREINVWSKAKAHALEPATNN